MALADIIQKIEADGLDRAQSLVDEANVKAVAIVAEAHRQAEATLAVATTRAEQTATREAHIISVNARLAARDITLSAKRDILETTYQGVREALVNLSDSDYAAFLSVKVAAAARGGESIAFGRADLRRASVLAEAIDAQARHLKLTVASEVAPFEYGALLRGDATSVDLSLEAIIAESRRQLDPILTDVLFGRD